MELFPLSYSEFIRYKELQNGESAVMEYLKNGGLPEYLKIGITVVLNALVNDIL